jgi:phage terminase large subunit GpA-like protein
MSPRVIQLPISGRDRRFYAQQLRTAEQAHRDICRRLTDAIKVSEAHRIAAWALSCEEWNIRQFIGGPVEPSPFIADAISAGFTLIEVKCKRCGREQIVDMTQMIWPRGKQVHTLANVLRCQRCRDEGHKASADLVAMRRQPEPEPTRPAAAKRRSAQ